jgi:uncharacterized repeat protein (TIGR01451 family)
MHMSNAGEHLTSATRHRRADRRKQLKLRRYRRRLTGAATFALLGALVVVPASADSSSPGGPTTTHGVQPEVVAGNPDCDDVGSASVHSFKIDAVADGSFTDPATGITFTLTIPSVDATPNEGESFDFEIDGGVALDVIVKGGPNANHYDYAGTVGPVASDTWLHAPVNPNNDRFFGLSHIEFCYDEAPAELEIVKTAVDDPITVGDHAAFDITVTSVGAATAENVTITDELPNNVLDWEIVSENDVPGADKCAITDGNTLHCDVGDLAPTSSFTVRVQTTEPIALGSDLCNTDLDNTAFADADNAEEVWDDATIRVECGAVQIDKVRKVPGEENTQPLEGAGFTLFEGHDALDDGTEVAVDPPGEVTTGADGVACFDGLPTDSNFTARETTTPDGYATANDTNVSTAGEADCDGVAGDPEVVTVENDPLTDLSITVTAQDPGATISSIECFEGEPADDLGGSIGGDSTVFTDPAQLDIEDLLEGVYTCRIEIDP